MEPEPINFTYFKRVRSPVGDVRGLDNTGERSGKKREKTSCNFRGKNENKGTGSTLGVPLHSKGHLRRKKKKTGPKKKGGKGPGKG